MNHLWSPWRMAYIQSTDKEKVCVFCLAQEQEDGLQNLIVHRGKYSYVILNRYPYTSGHLMVLPYAHVTGLDDLSAETNNEMMMHITQCIKTLQSVYHPQGFNIGANIGSAAGAGIPKHFHFHVVPRWEGDTNFLSSVGETRLVPEALEVTYQRVKKGWARLSSQRKEEK